MSLLLALGPAPSLDRDFVCDVSNVSRIRVSQDHSQIGDPLVHSISEGGPSSNHGDCAVSGGVLSGIECASVAMVKTWVNLRPIGVDDLPTGHGDFQS